MRARRFVPLIAAAFLLVPALSASAHISSFFITVATGEGSSGNFDWNFVHGTITCTAGEKFLVTAKITDADYAGKGRTRGTCTGEPQNWSIELTDESGTGQGPGPARISAKAHTKLNGEHHDSERDTIGG